MVSRTLNSVTSALRAFRPVTYLNLHSIFVIFLIKTSVSLPDVDYELKFLRILISLELQDHKTFYAVHQHM